MLELLLLVCLRADPAMCQERSLTFVEPQLSPLACMMFAQPTIAQYMQSHPDSRVARWKCGPAGRVSFDGRVLGQPI